VTTWTPKSEQTETWTGRTLPTPATWNQSGGAVETWTSRAPSLRAFSPNGFSRAPNFSTGSHAGAWDKRAIEAETWTEK
jgi:hypothetical protein